MVGREIFVDAVMRCGYEGGVADELEDGAMNMVGAALGKNADEAG